MEKKSKIENPIVNKPLPKRSSVHIRFNSDEEQDLVYEYDRFIEQKILEHKNSKKRTPRPKSNDFYAQALIRGMKRDLFDNKTDEIAEIAAKAVRKVLEQDKNAVLVRQNAQTAYLASNLEYLTNILNYLTPILQALNYDYYEETMNPETGFVKEDFLKSPVGFEEIQKKTFEKWKNKIRKDTTTERLSEVLFGKERNNDD